MPTWSTAIGSGDNIQSTALWNMLLSALLERYKGAFGDANGVGNLVSTIPNLPGTGGGLLAGGEIIQSAGNFIAPFQNAVTDMLSYYVDHRITYPENTDRWLLDDDGTGLAFASRHAFWLAPGYGGLQRVRPVLGLPTTKWYESPGGSAPLTHLAGNDNVAWIRKRPREIFGNTATNDLHSNPAVAGQRAYLLSDGTRWRCIASGNWIRDESGRVDVLSNLNDPPNAINSAYVTGFSSSGFQTDTGDYFGGWILEEARQIINLMRWAARPVDDEENSSTHTESRSVTDLDPSTDPAVFPGNTYAGIVGDLTTRWPGTPTIHSWLGEGLNGFPQVRTDIDSDAGSPPTWKGDAYRSDATWTLGSTSIPLNDALGTMSKSYQWMTFAEAYNGGTFDANGDPVSNLAWNIWNSGGPSTAAMLTSPTFGNVGTIPNFEPSPGGSRGYNMLSAWVLLKFDVAGGFAYLY